MNIHINGDKQQFEDKLTAAKLVEQLAMEVNQEIVPRSSYESFQLNENDRVEIINAVGGG